jgi:hypothetical protein
LERKFCALCNGVELSILYVLGVKEKNHELKAAPKDDKEGDSDETKDALSKSSISDQAQHGN